MTTKQVIDCPTCEGLGEQKIVAKMLTSKGWRDEPAVMIPCILCNGTGKVTTAKIKALEKAQEEFWCKCEDQSDVHFVGDGMDKRCTKHHYRCNVCDKVVQVG